VAGNDFSHTDATEPLRAHGVASRQADVFNATDAVEPSSSSITAEQTPSPSEAAGHQDTASSTSAIKLSMPNITPQADTVSSAADSDGQSSSSDLSPAATPSPRLLGQTTAETQSRDSSPGEAVGHDNSPGEAEAHDNSPGEAEGRDSSPGATEGHDNKPGEAEGQDNSPGEAEAHDSSPGEAEGHDNSPGEAESHDNSPGEAEGHDSSPGEAEAHDNKPGEAEGQDNRPGATEGHDNKPGEAEGHDNSPGEAEAHDNSPGSCSTPMSGASELTQQDAPSSSGAHEVLQHAVEAPDLADSDQDDTGKHHVHASITHMLIRLIQV